MKIALAQFNSHIGNFEGNFAKMKDYIDQAVSQSADMICFPELSVCGYPPRDFLEFDDFIKECESVVERLKSISHDIAIVVGSPVRNPVPEGKDLYNAAIFLHEGEVKHVQHKTLLPTYDIFDEYRYFEPGDVWEVFEFKGKKISLTVCEDLWNVGNDNPLYKICPMDEMIAQNPDFIINLSASPFSYDHAADRIRVLQENSARYNVPIFYVNQVGAQTEVVFDGGSVVLGKDKNVYREMPYFQEALEIFDLDEVASSTEENRQHFSKMQLIHDAIIRGIRDYFQKLGFSKAILGLSGGIDSAVTAALAAEALGPKNVYCVMMPSRFSSDHSIADSERLVHNMGIPADIIPIKNGYDTMIETLSPYFHGKEFDVTEENMQARLRAVILMALSNKHGYILLNTSNKSEAAVGYGTLYGDMCGGLSVIGDVYKTEVYELAEYINRHGEKIPSAIINKPPSAELRPNQKDSDSLPPYEVLDKILFQYIEKTTDPEDIVAMGFDPKIVSRVLRLVNINEFKRYQTPPIIRVSDKAFGMGRRMPIVGKYLS